DLIKLATSKLPPDSPAYRKILQETIEYYGKTDTYQYDDFASLEMPAAYRRLLEVMWRLGKHEGYEPKASSN
ncbi:MAG TPA: hypothetical protein VIJ68_03015, partial [Candidatus Saccharimonadales bacterium]